MQFEETDIWNKSKDLAVEVLRETLDLKHFGFKDQITRSALSVPSNIAEGMERRSDKELLYFLSISKASCGEFKTQTIVGAEAGFLEQSLAEKWSEDSEVLARMLGGFIRFVAGGRDGSS